MRIPLPSHWQLWCVYAPLIGAAGAIFVWLMSSIALSPLVEAVPFGIVLLVLVVIAIWLVWAIGRIDALAEEVATAGNPAARRAVLERVATTDKYLFNSWAAKRWANRLSGYALGGLSVRVSWSRQPVKPIVVHPHWFEPQEIDDRSAGFDALRSLNEEADSSSGQRKRRHMSRRRLVTFAAVGIAANLLFLASFVMMAMFGSSFSWMEIAFVFPAYLAGLFAMSRQFGWLQKQWLMVPGGVVVRRPQSFGEGWSGQLYRRPSSVMVLIGVGRQMPMVAIADDAGKASRSLTIGEAEKFLAGWLSQHEPPDAERLGELLS